MTSALVLTGSGTGANYAGELVKGLMKRRIPIDMVCASSIPAAALLLCRGCVCCQEIPLLLTPETANAASMQNLLEQNREMGCFRLPLGICTVDLETGTPVLFYDYLKCDAWNLKVRPLIGNEGSALQGTVSPALNFAPVLLEDMRLCDFGVKHGLPTQLPRMLGAKRLLSIQFTGADSPAEVAAESVTQLTSGHSDLFYPLRLEPENIQQQMEDFLDKTQARMLEGLLF